MKKKTLILLFFLFEFVFSQDPIQQVLVGGVAHVGDGSVIYNSTIVIRDGKILNIGSSDTIIYDKQISQVFNIRDKHIYPSLILPNTTLGLAEIDAVRASRDEREVGVLNANVRSQIAYNTESIVVSTVRTNGILLAQVTPRGGLIGGTSSIMKLHGNNWKDATYLENDGLHIYWPETYHRGHWTHSHDFTAKDKSEETDRSSEIRKLIIELEDFFDDAHQYISLTQKQVDLRYAALVDVFMGLKTLYIHVNTVSGIKQSILFAQKYDIKKIVLVGASESWRITNFLSDYNIPIILQRIHSLPIHEDDDINQPFKTPKILKDAGILFCLDYHGDMERMGSRNLPFLAGTTVSFGFDKEEALKLITSNPAAILGIADRTGTLENGKDANLFVSSGDILEVFSHNVEMLFLMGEQISLSNHQTELYQKYLKK